MGKVISKIGFPDSYVVLDTETTGLDPKYDAVIEVGLLKISNSKIVDKFSSLVRPAESMAFLPLADDKTMSQEEIETFYKTHLISDYITDLTGITNEMLLNAPLFSSIANEIYNFIGDFPIVGHNVSFDYKFLDAAMTGASNTHIGNDIICTMRISRKFLPSLSHHRLSDICQALKISRGIEHRAVDDAEATFRCFDAIKTSLIAEDRIDEFISSFSKKKSMQYTQYGDGLVPTVDEIDETNPLFGKVVVFTGALTSMTRKEAFQEVVNQGGIPSDSLTKKTNFLVVGNKEFAKSVKDGKTSKMKKAESYRLKGEDIIVISEGTFFDMFS